MPVELLQSTREERENVQEPEFIENILRPMEKAKGDSLPVSTFYPLADGTFPAGTTAYENAVLRHLFPNGLKRTVSSATSVRISARMRVSVRFC